MRSRGGDGPLLTQERGEPDWPLEMGDWRGNDAVVGRWSGTQRRALGEVQVARRRNVGGISLLSQTRRLAEDGVADRESDAQSSAAMHIRPNH